MGRTFAFLLATGGSGGELLRAGALANLKSVLHSVHCTMVPGRGPVGRYREPHLGHWFSSPIGQTPLNSANWGIRTSRIASP